MGATHNHHHHHPTSYNKAFFIATSANGIFVVIQILYAIWANSTSLLADAVHNLGDVMGLALAWIANSLLQRKPTSFSTYGLKKSSIMAAMANGLLLIFTCGIIAAEAFYKFISPEPVHAVMVIIVAAIGIVVNGATAALFIRGHNDLNIRGAFLHLFYDALISAGVVVSATLMYFTNWLWLDPLMGLLIAIIIIKGTWTLFKDSFRLMIDAVPKEISLEAVKERLEKIPGVKQVHDLHIWALSTRENALSVHLWMPEENFSDESREKLVHELKHQYRIDHVTVQIERDLSFCEDSCAH